MSNIRHKRSVHNVCSPQFSFILLFATESRFSCSSVSQAQRIQDTTKMLLSILFAQRLCKESSSMIIDLALNATDHFLSFVETHPFLKITVSCWLSSILIPLPAESPLAPRALLSYKHVELSMDTKLSQHLCMPPVFHSRGACTFELYCSHDSRCRRYLIAFVRV